VFQTKDQIGSYFYFPSINFQKAAGGFGSIRVNNRNVIAVPFPKPEAEFDLLIGDWFYDSYNVSDRNLFMRTHDTSCRICLMTTHIYWCETFTENQINDGLHGKYYHPRCYSNEWKRPLWPFIVKSL